jgi:hypothetical protein
MGAWVQDTDGGYVNLDQVQVLTVTTLDSGVTWRISTGSRRLTGSYATQADAETAMQNLVNGVTVADLIS